MTPRPTLPGPGMDGLAVDATTGVTAGLVRTLGPICRGCRTTEARCAWVGGCCDGCSHFAWLDADGNERKGTGEFCGSEKGYQSHRWRREATCGPCKAAHSRHNLERAS